MKISLGTVFNTSCRNILNKKPNLYLFMQNYHQPLLPSETYHLFNRAVGNERLFIEERNYAYFLEKLDLHTDEIAHILTYSLLPNHFHLVVKLKSNESIAKNFEKFKKVPYDPLLANIPDFIMERFSNFLNSYAKSFNKMYRRKGSLFIDYLKRSKVQNEGDLTTFIFIHIKMRFIMDTLLKLVIGNMIPIEPY